MRRLEQYTLLTIPNHKILFLFNLFYNKFFLELICILSSRRKKKLGLIESDSLIKELMKNFYYTTFRILFLDSFLLLLDAVKCHCLFSFKISKN